MLLRTTEVMRGNAQASGEGRTSTGLCDTRCFFQNDLSPIASYDTRTITKQSFSKLQLNSKFGTFTKKTCESIEKFHSEMNELDQDIDAQSTDNGLS